MFAATVSGSTSGSASNMQSSKGPTRWTEQTGRSGQHITASGNTQLSAGQVSSGASASTSPSGPTQMLEAFGPQSYSLYLTTSPGISPARFVKARPSLGPPIVLNLEAMMCSSPGQHVVFACLARGVDKLPSLGAEATSQTLPVHAFSSATILSVSYTHLTLPTKA